MEDDIKWMELGLQRILNESDFEKVTTRNKKRGEATFLAQRQKHIFKLDALRRKHEEGRNKSVEHTRSSGHKWIVNLSSCELNDSQQQVLQRGLNFAPTPTRIPTMEIIAGVEPALRRHRDKGAACAAKAAVCNIVRKAKPPPSNITKDERRALEELRKIPILSSPRRIKGTQRWSWIVRRTRRKPPKSWGLLSKESARTKRSGSRTG